MAGFEVPDGMVVQAFRFTLDLTPAQAACVRRHFGGRRYAYNWAVRTMRADIAAFHAGGAASPAPSMFGLRKRWNQAKDTECVDGATGEVWWTEVSKEAFADGIAGAVDASSPKEEPASSPRPCPARAPGSWSPSASC